MKNNQIIIADSTLRAYARRTEQGIVDAEELAEEEWEQLCDRNVNSPRAKAVQCGFCWIDHGEVQWMQTYNSQGTRHVRHQPGEASDHPYQSVEGPRHKAYKERAYLLGDREGLDPEKESEAEDGRTIADTLLRGAVNLAYEHQHSQFKAGYGLTERIQRAANVDRVALFHTDQDHVFNAQQAPILRTDGDVPFEWITDLNRPLIVTGGLREIIVFPCDARNGVWCPRGRIAGCGKTHARTEPLRGVALDEALIHGAMDEYRYIFNAQVTKAPKSFWTDRKSYDRYMSALGGDGKLAPLEGAPVDKAKTRNGARSGHSRRGDVGLMAMRAQAVDLSTLAAPEAPVQAVVDAAPKRPVAPVLQRPASGGCSHWIGSASRYCQLTDGVRRYLPGFRCPAHTPNALQGKPEIPPGPGWPIHRQEGR